MLKRLIGVLLLVLLLALAAPAMAAAVEEPAAAEPGAAEQAPPPPDLEELCATERITSQFCPLPYEEPSWFQWLLYPLLAVGLLMALGLLFAYLYWQPRFARERGTRTRR